MARPVKVRTAPCEFCGKVISKTGKEASQRRYWTCDASCANKLRIQKGNTPGWGENPYRGMQDTRPCANCGVPVTRYLKPRNVDGLWFHSKSCRAQYNSRKRVAEGTWKQPRRPRRGDTVSCETCGKDFYREPAIIRRNGRFCSDECWNEAQRAGRIKKVCVYCGQEFLIQPSVAHQKHCTRRCMADDKIARPLDRSHNGRPARMNDKGYILLWEPEHPKAMKGWVFEHRLVMEQILGRYLRSDEHVDHIRADEKWNNDPSNLQVLSPSDHSKKTNADNLGALPVLRDRLKELEEEAVRREVEIAAERATREAEIARLQAQLKEPVVH